MKLVAAVLTGAWLAGGHRARGPATHPCGGRACDGRRRRHVQLRGRGQARRERARHLERADLRRYAGRFAQVGPTTTRRSTLGSAVVVRLEQRLGCLDLACAPGARCPPNPPARGARERARRRRRRDDGASAAVAVAVEPRVSTAAVRAAAPPYRQQTELPAATSDAGRLAGLLAIAAATLGLVAVLLAALGLRPRGRAAGARGAARTGAPAPPRVGQAAGSGPQARGGPRLARAGADGAQSLADDAARFAWSASLPGPRRRRRARRARRGTRRR